MGIFGKKQPQPQPQETPVYQFSYMGNWIKIYPNRIDFKYRLGSESIPLNQIASVEVVAVFGQVNIVTTGGRKYEIPTNKKKEVQQAIIDAQARLTSGSPSQVSSADELAKFHDLKEKGIISQEEFDRKKKELLG